MLLLSSTFIYINYKYKNIYIYLFIYLFFDNTIPLQSDAKRKTDKTLACLVKQTNHTPHKDIHSPHTSLLTHTYHTTHQHEPNSHTSSPIWLEIQKYLSCTGYRGKKLINDIIKFVAYTTVSHCLKFFSPLPRCA